MFSSEAMPKYLGTKNPAVIKEFYDLYLNHMDASFKELCQALKHSDLESAIENAYKLLTCSNLVDDTLMTDVLKRFKQAAMDNDLERCLAYAEILEPMVRQASKRVQSLKRESQSLFELV
jgi:hypothetical protein